MANDDFAFDKVIASVGGNGKYQKLLLAFYLVPLHTIYSVVLLVQIFQMSTPPHWCNVPGRPANQTLDQWRNQTIPRQHNGAWSSCKQFATDQTQDSLSERLIIDCESGWTYDKTWYDRTIVTDNDWVCAKQSYAAQWITMSTIGMMLGIILFTNLADRVGRKPMVIIGTLTFSLLNVMRICARSRWALYTAMLLSSIPSSACLSISFIFVAEQMSPAYRSMATTASFISWVAGTCVLSLLAWISRNWVTMGVVTCVLCVAHLPVQWYFGESARWLACNGRMGEAKAVLTNIARTNGKTATDFESKLPALSKNQSLQTSSTRAVLDLFVNNKIMTRTNGKTATDFESKLPALSKNQSLQTSSTRAVLDLFVNNKIMTRTILLTISLSDIISCLLSGKLVKSSSCILMVYYALLYNNENMVGNPFVNFCLSGLAEIPATYIAFYSNDWLGRRVTSSAFQVLTALCIAVVISAQDTLNSGSFAILLLAKTFITTCFFTLYLQYVEIFPTSHRTTATGFTTVVGNAFEISVPYIVQSDYYGKNFPYIICIVICMVGAIAAYILPETLGKDLPQTIEDVEKGFDKQSLTKYHGKTLQCLSM